MQRADRRSILARTPLEYGPKQKEQTLRLAVICWHIDGVSAVIVAGFTESKGHIGDRLIATLCAGLAAGGEAGPVHSAGVKIVDQVPWPVVDLRCDWSENCPIEAIATAWGIYKPQLDAYIQRAIGSPRSTLLWRAGR